MKNSIIILVFLFAFTGSVNAQEAKSAVKKTACCSSDKETACKDMKKACDTSNPNCCLLAEAEKKCCSHDKTKAVSSSDKNSCKTNSSCCGDCKESKAKS